MCGAVFCKMGSKPAPLGFTELLCSAAPGIVPGALHPRGLFHSYGRGWAAVEMLGQLYVHGCHCEDALNIRSLARAPLSVVSVSP